MNKIISLVLMLAMSVVLSSVGMASVVYAGAGGDSDGDVEIERNNEILQAIEQTQEACTNAAEVGIETDGDVSASISQSNTCEVTQSQTAEQNAAIVDESTNIFD